MTRNDDDDEPLEPTPLASPEIIYAPAPESVDSTEQDRRDNPERRQTANGRTGQRRKPEPNNAGPYPTR